MKATVLPMIHLNGTPAETLFKEYRDVMDALSETLDKVYRVTLHSRDYYVIDNDAYSRAAAEFRGHMKALNEAREYFESVALSVMEQGKL
jgi:hypothetical protein